MERKNTPNQTTTFTDTTLADLARWCKALGHPARLAILKHLIEVDQCVCGRIVDILPLAQSTVSQHLKKLKDAGLIKGEVDGPSICYCVDREVLGRLNDGLLSLYSEEEKVERLWN
jgi:ArsR family transcriptional regulator